ncbi:MAG: DUF2530 domain-containing protein [Bifidobacteriaceae bacterium]|jgi:hypothetical protein|nr:DUF2530 domain-containing protein [Bifidobacteriaceae bacterium]
MPQQPTTPPQVTVNHPLLFGVGTGLWLAALALLATLDLMGVYRARVWLAVCAAGVALGVVGVVYTKHSWRTRGPEEAPKAPPAA